MTADAPATAVSAVARLAKIPHHVAIIMDGNGRWAQARGLPRLAGHRAGTENMRRVLEACGRVRRQVSDCLCLFHRELASPYGRSARPDGYSGRAS